MLRDNGNGSTALQHPYGEARPAWKVLRVLGNLFHCEGFDYQNAHEIHDKVKNAG